MNAECTVGSALVTRRRAKPPTNRELRLVRVRGTGLTERENQLVHQLIHGAGDSNKAIAYALGMSAGTVKVYFSHLTRKVGGPGGMSRVALALWAERRWNDQSGGDR